MLHGFITFLFLHIYKYAYAGYLFHLCLKSLFFAKAQGTYTQSSW